MNNIKRVFSIKDLENLSGIKAHTIRIWEKRYNLLEPERTDTNIRLYNAENLQKLLNITLLYNNGFKISKIADLSAIQLIELTQQVINKQSVNNHVINAFKVAMVNFDTELFYNTYNNINKEKSFSAIFTDYFIPLLDEVGLLWQSDTINPAHEHFIANLIKQKITYHIEQTKQNMKVSQPNTFVLYLPENEIHDIGLLFLYYQLVNKGYHTIYLGPTMPLENLIDLTHTFKQITFLTYFTVAPTTEKINEYTSHFEAKLNTDNNNQLWLIGQKVTHLIKPNFNEAITTFTSIGDLVKKL